jgi:7,8-dihydro-6-hydroxymethylpterin-pyrophosphokinase
MNDHHDTEGEVLLGLGANQGDPVAQLAKAVEALSREVRIGAVSSVYRSEPVGFAAQGVEEALGRRRTFRDAPRTIDVDLLAYGGRVMRTGELMLPHPRLHLRGFVLHPLVEVAPEWPHPVLLKTARELLSTAAALERVERVGALPGFGAPLAPAPPSG